jgi:hypothetical protein
MIRIMAQPRPAPPRVSKPRGLGLTYYTRTTGPTVLPQHDQTSG